MKPLPLLLVVSLLANVGLLVAYRPRANVAPVKPEAAPRVAGDATQQAAEATKRHAALQAALASGDATALAAAGVPAETIRAITVGRAFDVFQGRVRAGRAGTTDERYWRRPKPDYLVAREVRLASRGAEQEFSDVVRRAYGEDLETMFGGANATASVLSPEKFARARQIERDYADLEEQVRVDQDSSVELRSDREKLTLLEKEKERDLDALITPAERARIELRDSSTAQTVRQRYGDVLQTEADYKKIYALQKAFDDQYHGANPTPETSRLRDIAERKLAEDIRAVLGPDQWAAAQRANDPDVETLAALTRRLNLAPAASDTALALRASYATQSLQISANSDLTPAERGQQLRALAGKAEAGLNAALGAEAGEAFAKRSEWLNLLRNGQAFATEAADAGAVPRIGTAVYPVKRPTK